MPARMYYSTQARRANWYGSNWIRKRKRYAIYCRDSWVCFYCGRAPERSRPRFVTLDHVLPLDAYLLAYDTPEGFNDPHNLITACRNCNEVKNGKTAEQYLRYQIDRLLLLYLRLALEPDYKAADLYI